jgi:hypothetical protein
VPGGVPDSARRWVRPVLAASASAPRRSSPVCAVCGLRRHAALCRVGSPRLRARASAVSLFVPTRVLRCASKPFGAARRDPSRSRATRDGTPSAGGLTLRSVEERGPRQAVRAGSAAARSCIHAAFFCKCGADSGAGSIACYPPLKRRQELRRGMFQCVYCRAC